MLLLLLICLLLRPAVSWLIVLVTAALLDMPLAWWQKPVEITGLLELAKLINHCHCDDKVIGIDLVHDTAHDNDTLTILDNLIVT